MKHKIAVVGLGYVGLPLSIEFSKHFKTVGFDINKKRINQLKNFNDINNEISLQEIKNKKKLTFSSNIDDIKKCNTYIITVPTPIDKQNNPDLKNILNACLIIGKILKEKDLIIFESTVYPGLTDEICIPKIEKYSKLKINKDFYCGYSPERINPGDKKRTLSKIIKITSGSNLIASKIVDNLYKKIIKAGTYNVSSIKVAEASKVIENTQRDLNVAFVNELAMIFSKMNIDTEEVLNAANTKWNFQKFIPGLVGGHCIGVDPYYLTYKAKKLGFKPKIISSGRTVNNNMAKFITKKINESITIKKNINSRILIMGITFKENCSDVRNTKVIDLYNQLSKTNNIVDVYDPIVNKIEVKKIYNLKLTNILKQNYYDAIVISVAHNLFKNIGIKKIRSYGKKKCLIFDLKYLFDKKNDVIRL